MGIPAINKVFTKSGKINKFDENDGFKPETEWMIDNKRCQYVSFDVPWRCGFY